MLRNGHFLNEKRIFSSFSLGITRFFVKFVSLQGYGGSILQFLFTKRCYWNYLLHSNFANYRIPFVIYWNTIYYKWYFISRNKTETKVLKNHILMFFMFLLFVFPSFDFILLSWWKIFKYCRGTKFVSSRKHLSLLTYLFCLFIHWMFCFQLQR